MSVMRSWSIALLLAVAIALPRPAYAQASEDPLERAEAAYLEVDFEGTLEAATAALAAGANNRRRLIRIYQLIGIAAAALGEENRSRDAYVRMLALDPEATVDRNLAPRLRSPFLEARGFWTARSDRLSVEATFVRSRGAFRIALTDPIGIVRELRVSARVPGQREYIVATAPASSSVLVPIDGAEDARGIEYAVAAVDEHGNELVALGTEDEPRVWGTMEIEPPRDGGAGDDDDDGDSVFESPVFWIVAGVVVVGGGTAAAFVLLDRDVEAETGVSFGFQ